MSQCTPIPTATEFATVTTNSVSTSLSESITTFPPQTTTITTTLCVSIFSGSDSSASLFCQTDSSVSTIPASFSTSTIPSTITVPVTITSPTATLFTTACSSNTTPPPQDSTTSTSTSTSTVESSTTLPNGEVSVTRYTTTVTSISTLSPQDNLNGKSSKPNIGAIAGGSAGGVILLLVIGFAIWYCFGRKSRDEVDFGLQEDLDVHPYPVRHQKYPRGPIDDDVVEPKHEYQYGQLNSNATTPSGYDHSADGRLVGAGPAGGISPWDPGHGSGHGMNIGAPPGGSSGYAAGPSTGYGGTSATSPVTTASNIPPSTYPHASYPNYPSQSYPPTQGYPSQPYPPQQPLSNHFVPAPVPAVPISVSGRSDSSRGPGSIDSPVPFTNSRAPLTVANPDASYTPYNDPRDTKYPPQPTASSSQPLLQHQDGGAVPLPGASSSSSSRPAQRRDSAAVSGSAVGAAGAAAEGESSLRRRRSTDKGQLRERQNEGDDTEPGPPAYEA
ncbi:hypothetical protein BXZ70DRAFT_238947 [Cristinia sonorae]|uniref:Uncharacterized protein n=1 Tax=Cristinia sonorae TaxID=1940300 RepID=A0A8K0UMT6_9AGAR|nr:hypothetical protein BXZ70DRAFT_238947 [Cristinia sonorae]